MLAEDFPAQERLACHKKTVSQLDAQLRADLCSGVPATNLKMGIEGKGVWDLERPGKLGIQWSNVLLKSLTKGECDRDRARKRERLTQRETERHTQKTHLSLMSFKGTNPTHRSCILTGSICLEALSKYSCTGNEDFGVWDTGDTADPQKGRFSYN